jgi:hypothetical protein
VRKRSRGPFPNLTLAEASFHFAGRPPSPPPLISLPCDWTRAAPGTLRRFPSKPPTVFLLLSPPPEVSFGKARDAWRIGISWICYEVGQRRLLWPLLRRGGETAATRTCACGADSWWQLLLERVRSGAKRALATCGYSCRRHAVFGIIFNLMKYVIHENFRSLQSLKLSMHICFFMAFLTE